MRPLEADEPTAVGPYRLLGRLGSGGMGRVYLGRSAGGRTVAVKIVHPHFALDEEFRARFRREVDAARRVGGAWTAPVLDADPAARVPWVATAYAAGPSLTAAVADGGGPLPAHTVRTLGAGLAEALTAVHALGLVHRDVKPSNVLLTLDGPLLIDFGIARATDSTASLTSTGVSVGSPGYMAPEQILGKGVTGAADVFSLGAVLVFAATGRPPFPGDSSAALLYKVVHEEPELDGLAGDLREPAAACLAKDPAARPSPAELARRLAPEGAARLVTAGWLPGPLVERVSRSAVQLLNLEAGAEAAGAGAEAGASGPVGFSSPAVRAGETGFGGFGPPPSPSPPPPVPVGPLPASAPVPAPRDAPPHPPTALSGGTPGRVSVSVTAASEQAGPGRTRKVSCTVALAVAGALAAVTVGSVFVLDLLPGGGSDGGDAGNDTARPPAATAPPSPSASASPSAGGAVPAAYLGTWTGQATARDGDLPLGTFRLTVAEARVGQELGTMRHTDILGGTCDDVLTLTEVTDEWIVAAAVGDPANRGVCGQARHTVRLTPVGDDLRYESDSAESGRPEARLSKTGAAG
ncbi:serine/threonine-protein kinase [Streptomyces sp. NPDC023723]|uniref:serine/threonine-protein kinase n=1 Tax=Streptomyces sp. NPDC023723 TaxID=3154323 RepID=UPI003410BF46